MDFVVYGKGVFAAIEVKRKRNPDPSDLSGLRAFAAECPEAALLLLCGCDREQIVDGIRIVPLALALPRLESLLWPDPR